MRPACGGGRTPSLRTARALSPRPSSVATAPLLRTVGVRCAVPAASSTPYRRVRCVPRPSGARRLPPTAWAALSYPTDTVTPWLPVRNPRRTGRPTAAPNAAGPPPSGSAVAPSARRGGRSRSSAAPPPCAPPPPAGSPRPRCRSARSTAGRRPPARRASASWTGCWAAGSSRARSCCWRASRASASRRCCWTWRPRRRATTTARCT